jgi:hypothetical protein
MDDFLNATTEFHRGPVSFTVFCSDMAEVFILLRYDTLLGNLLSTFLDNAEVSIFEGY